MKVSRLHRWWKARKERARIEAHNRGYDYAAGAFLRGEKSLEDLEGESYGFYSSPFDEGMGAAIRALGSAILARDL